MISKLLRHSPIFIILIANYCHGGLLATLGDQHHYQHQVASSFMHFHGPIEGPEYEIKVLEHHHEDNHLLHNHENHYTHDYMAHPKYQFSYGVEDHHTGDFHSQKETRDGHSVSGEYSIAEPGGGLRVVSYHADKDGFHAVVHTSGKNEHHGFPQGHLAIAATATEQQQLLQEYPAASYDNAQHEETTY
ncbi:cuticle protein 21-like [Phymastichus coffea]|uniref:cuticle protein 21-like n=1 Tax=Phymastichus coffea TaxID=108790 RepID=UPI00273BF495|nr:cuticle protein 21-like [Phymastichus coffea]